MTTRSRTMVKVPPVTVKTTKEAAATARPQAAEVTAATTALTRRTQTSTSTWTSTRTRTARGQQLCRQSRHCTSECSILPTVIGSSTATKRRQKACLVRQRLCLRSTGTTTIQPVEVARVIGDRLGRACDGCPWPCA